MKVIYIDDNRSNLGLMETVVKAIEPPAEFFGTDSVYDFLSEAGEPDSLFIIDFTLDGLLGDYLYEKLLSRRSDAKVIIVSAGFIKDISNFFVRFDHKPIAITDRFGAIDIIRKELESGDGL